MNNKKEPQKCDAQVCCKATAQLQKEIEEEKSQEDKPLGEILKDDEDKDSQE